MPRKILSPRRILKHAQNPPGQTVGITRFDQLAVLTVLDKFRNASDARGHNRPAVGHRLHEYHRDALREAGQDDHVRLFIEQCDPIRLE